jgi:hypothetical protein
VQQRKEDLEHDSALSVPLWSQRAATVTFLRSVDGVLRA